MTEPPSIRHKRAVADGMERAAFCGVWIHPGPYSLNDEEVVLLYVVDDPALDVSNAFGIGLGMPASSFFDNPDIQKATTITNQRLNETKSPQVTSETYHKLIASYADPAIESSAIERVDRIDYMAKFTPGTTTLMGLPVSRVFIEGEYDTTRKEHVICRLVATLAIDANTSSEKTTKTIVEQVALQFGPAVTNGGRSHWGPKGPNAVELYIDDKKTRSKSTCKP